MFFKLFNWLVKRKRVPYILAVLLPVDIWSVLMGFPAFFLIWVLGADLIEAAGTLELFIFSFFSLLFLAFLGAAIEMGALRLFGIKFERKHIKPLNENIYNNHIRPDISNEELLQIYSAFNKFDRWVIKTHIKYVLMVIVGTFLMVGLINHEWNFAFLILETLILFGAIALICGIPLWELLTISVRKECKMLLRQRGEHFEEVPFMSLRTKSNFFTILIALAFLTVLILIRSLDPILLIFLCLILAILIFLTGLVFKSIYETFNEVKESAKDLALGKITSFSTGSLDKEIIDLSQSLNKTAQEISNYQQALEEEKTSLEIKVKARTRELEELAQGLDQQVKERTEELQKKVNELEKWYHLTVGRELKMVELKEKIKELEEKMRKEK